MLHDTADDINAFAAFPLSHWKKIWSTNPAITIAARPGVSDRSELAGIS